MHYHYYPQEYLDLANEIPNHKMLVEQLQDMPPEADLADRMGLICAYCGIVLDGYYDAAQVSELTTKCTVALRKAREELVEDIMKPITP